MYSGGNKAAIQDEEEQKANKINFENKRRNDDEHLTQQWSEANTISDIIVARQKELDNIESAMKLVSDMVTDMFKEIKEQGFKIDLIVTQTRSTKENIKKGLKENQISENRQKAALGTSCWIWILITVLALLIIGFAIFMWYKTTH